MTPVRHVRTFSPLLLTALSVLALTACSGDTGRDIVTGDGTESSETADTTESPAPTQDDSDTTDDASVVSTPGTPTPTSSPASPSTTIGAAPDDAPDTGAPSVPAVAADPRNVYAFAAAQAIADAANSEGIDEADEETVSLILETAGEAAYEIEYPSAVEYLEVDIDEDVVTITTEGDFGDGVETGTAYVCIVDGRAVAAETACRP